MAKKNNIIDFDAHRIRPYLLQVIEGFLGDPPDSDFQCGFLAAICAVYEEGLGLGKDDARLVACDKLIKARPKGKRK